MITLKQLRYLTALAEHRHFGKAAEACAVTQPALSMQIRELEKDLGIDLVERRPGEVILTETGAEVTRRAERVLAAARDLTEFARHSGRLLTGRLRLGVIPTLAPYVLPRILPALQQRFPDLRVELRETQTRILMDELIRGALDAVLLALPLDEGEIESTALFDDPFLLAVPAAEAPPEGARMAARRCARHRSAAADPARGRTLPARPGARVLRRRARRRTGRARRDLAFDRDADGGERLRRHAGAEDRGRVELRDERVKVLRFRDPRAGALDRARVAAHLAAQGGLRGARPDRARDARRMKRVAVIGAGPAGLMAAEVLAQGGAQVTVYDRMPSAGRKFLMAGRGGLNLTHSEPLEPFLARYGAAADALRAAIEAFPPDALRAWAEALGQETFVGSSGRVFPRAMKASPLLRAWLRRLDAAGVRFALRHHWAGWDERAPRRSRRRTARSRSRRTRPCWRSAARAGRGSARTAAGPTR